MAASSAREAVRAAWLRRNGSRVPFMIEAGPSVRATRALLNDPSADLACQEGLLDSCAAIDDDSLPSLKPNVGIGIMATVMGCPWVPDDTTDPWVHAVISDDSPFPGGLRRSPDLTRDGLMPTALERIDFFQEKGRYPLRCVNIPSPLLTASLVWEYGSFIAALQTQPREAHALLEDVTKATREFLLLQRSRIRDLFGYTHESVWIPPDVALRLSDDVAAVLTADLYREFGARYNAMLAEGFPGLVIHSCGDVSRALPAILETPGLVGIDIVAPQNDMGRIVSMVDRGAALCLRFFDWDFPVGTKVDLLDYARRLVDTAGTAGTILWTHTPGIEEARALARGMRRELGR